ncbi:acyltransferase family protein [Catenuloplanes sp. NPDC051500]|uniref:acyltransferase family protein n=1 Tax=Catenuloplanes sp. NPDC051500 TaxID=3363959 RepID=UPI0037B22173
MDLLRLVAALAVVVFHYTFSGPENGYINVEFPEIKDITRYGYLGVDLFFLISGLVVLMSAWDRDVRGFLVSRATRLYPAFWVACCLTAAVVAVAGAPHFRATPGQFLANLTMLHPALDVASIDVVYWTLWSEVRFYLVVVLLIVVGMTRRRVLTALWIWLGLTLVLEAGLLPGRVAGVADLALQTHYSHYFIAGMAMFLIGRFGPSPSLIALIGLCWANALYRGALFAGEVGARYHETISPIPALIVIHLCLTVLLLVVTRRTERLGRSWFTTAGTITYPLYLMHHTIGMIVITRLDGSVGRYPLVLGVTAVMVLAAVLLHRTVERPLGASMSRALRRPPVPAQRRAADGPAVSRVRG